MVGVPYDRSGEVGNPYDNSVVGAGAAYVFARSQGSPAERYVKAPQPTWSGFGYSLDIAPGYLVVGAPDEMEPPLPPGATPAPYDRIPSGAVYVFSIDD